MRSLVALLLPAALLAQVPLPEPRLLRAQYSWGYVGRDGEGQGTLSVLLEPAAGRVVLELHGLGERLCLLSGSAGAYHLQIPRNQTDKTVPDFGSLPLPFLPQLGDVGALMRLLTKGQGPGVKVTASDAKGPRKLKYAGKDQGGNEVLVWLERKRWEPE